MRNFLRADRSASSISPGLIISSNDRLPREKVTPDSASSSKDRYDSSFDPVTTVKKRDNSNKLGICIRSCSRETDNIFHANSEMNTLKQFHMELPGNWSQHRKLYLRNVKTLLQVGEEANLNLDGAFEQQYIICSCGKRLFRYTCRALIDKLCDDRHEGISIENVLSDIG